MIVMNYTWMSSTTKGKIGMHATTLISVSGEVENTVVISNIQGNDKIR